MSRKGKVPIPLPSGVEVKLEGKVISVKGPKGSLKRDLMKGIVVKIDKGELHVSLAPEMSHASNFHGLYWALIANMVQGVSQGFVKKLEMVGVGYRAAVQGKLLDLQIGLSHPTKISIPDGVAVVVEKNTVILVSGMDKQAVGQFAADVRGKKPPEPYKGKGIRYADEYVRKKAGKTGKK